MTFKKDVVHPNVGCLSVLNGWKSHNQVTGESFGPVFNNIQDLWTWQKENLDIGTENTYTAPINTGDTPMNLTNRLIKMSTGLIESLTEEDQDMLNSEAILTPAMEQNIQDNQAEILRLARFRSKIKSGDTDYDQTMMMMMIEIILDEEAGA
jgi:hypothetical protein